MTPDFMALVRTVRGGYTAGDPNFCNQLTSAHTHTTIIFKMAISLKHILDCWGIWMSSNYLSVPWSYTISSSKNNI